MSDAERERLREVFRSELKEIVEEAIRNQFAENHFEAVCHCGISVEQHKRQHDQIAEFFETLGDLSKTARRTMVQILVSFLIAAMAFGVVVKAGWIKIGG